jgi:Putative phage tail protein
MATLVLTAVGTALGGPLGGAIGAALGQQVDRAAFANGPAGQGPRLKELDIQTSSYGTYIPAIFGAMRVAGTLIWASDLVEQSVKTNNGKGRPATQNYSYSANFAVALSSQPLHSIGRIWADGNLLRGVAGDFKTPTGFRFYNGFGDQQPDPLLASADMQGGMIAYRDMAYVVFEGLQLADFGNRIPSLTFEVFERIAPISIDSIAAKLSRDLIIGDSGEELHGYAASGSDARAALAPLIDAMPVRLQWRDGHLRLTGNTATQSTTHSIETLSAVGSRMLPNAVHQLRPIDAVPSRYALRYYDPSRDYQIGIQSSERGDNNRRNNVVELPAALNAFEVKRLTEVQLSQLHRQRPQWSGYVADKAGRYEIGDWIALSENEPRLRIVEIEYQRGYCKLTAIGSMNSPTLAIFPTAAGVHVPSADLAIGQSRLVALDLPAMSAIVPDTPIVVAAAAGTGPGWRSAALSQVVGDQSLDLGQTAAPAVIGVAENILPSHSPRLFDRENMLEISVLHSGMLLPLAPPNGLIWVEGEILRYKLATPLSSTRYRLTQLERGLFGTENRVGTHQLGDRFIVLDQDRLRLLDVDSREIGRSHIYSALGVGDEMPITAALADIGQSVRPFAPIHGQFSARSDGGADISWVRRARVDFGWADGVDHPIVEDQERYAVSLINAGQTLALWETGDASLSIAASQWAALLLSTGPNAEIYVRQIGRHAISAPLIIAIF